MSTPLELVFAPAGPDEADEVAEVSAAAARDLTARFGEGHWSREPTGAGLRSGLRRAPAWLAREGGRALATFRLATRKPWAIDPAWFTPCARPLYLTDMAVHPDFQRRGVGRRCMEEMLEMARRWPAGAIRLDAYDAPAGAGGFYARCGFAERGRVTYRSTPLVYYEHVL
jgi:GNAT superfamily N-acetyltransferase